MQELKATILAEQPSINRVIANGVSQMPPLSRPVAEHVLFAGGKRLRPVLTLLCGRLFGSCSQDLYLLGSAVEMLHAATLLHDDILDNASTRRGEKAAHLVFGSTKAILAGDALLAKALHMVSALGDARLTACISEAVLQTAEGELAEFTHLRDLSISQENYLSIITGKTAWMLRAACELGAIRAGASAEQVEALAQFGLELGIAFQMVDDALDFSPEIETGKPSGGDVREGKVTPPLLFYLASLEAAEAGRLRASFSSAGLAEGELADLCAKIVAGGHVQKTRDLAEQHLRSALTNLKKLPGGAEWNILEQMLEYIRRRTK